MNLPTPSRFRLAVASALLIATASVAGCSGTETPPADASPTIDLEAAEAARDDLIRAVQDAAIAISGAEATPNKDIPTRCIKGEGAGFNYAVSIPLPENDQTQDSIARVADAWTKLGIDVNVEESAVYTTVMDGVPPTRPVTHIVTNYIAATEGYPAAYQIEGYSKCFPGDRYDYYDLTGRDGGAE